MEPDRPDQQPMEVLESGRPPGPVERWAGSLLRRRGARTVLAGALAVVLSGLWIAFSPARDGTPAADPAEAEEAAALTGSPGLRLAPAIGRQGDAGSTWKVSPDVAVRSGPSGHTVTFFAANRGLEAQDPREIRVTASFIDRPRLEYTAACAGVRLTPHGYRPLAGDVAAGRRVLVRCTDTTDYRGTPARIDAKSVVVRTTPCHEGESGGF